MKEAVAANYEMIVAALRDDFITDARDKIDQIDDVLDAIEAGEGRYENHLLDIQRLVHSIKGMAGSFGFMSISRIAHAMEDYVEIVSSQSAVPIKECRNFIAAIDQVLTARSEPTEEEAVMLLDGLPVPHHRNANIPDKMLGKAVVLMPKGLQRKIMAQELVNLGFRVIIADDPLELMDVCLSGLPDIVVTSMMLDRLSGTELAKALGVIDRTKHIRVAVFTSDDTLDGSSDELPASTGIIRKGPTMSRDFLGWLKAQQVL